MRRKLFIAPPQNLCGNFYAGKTWFFEDIFLPNPSSFNAMCLAIPGKILAIEGTTARADFGSGTIRSVDISLVDAEVGDYVLVHTGYAIQVLDEEEAEKTLEIWREILGAEDSTSDSDG